MKLFSFKGGVHPYEGKELTEDKSVRNLDPGPELAFLLSQHIGAPAKAVVAKGDRVLVGQKIAEAGGFVSEPIFSSVSGTVKKIEKRRSAPGGMVDAIIVENDNQYETVEFTPLPGVNIKPESGYPKPMGAKEAFDAIHPDEVLAKVDKKEILDRIKNAGIVGMGGAGFPTHVKLSPKDPSRIDYILVNGSECEPYITGDYRMMMDHPGEIVAGLKAVLKLFDGAKGVFCIENNKPRAIQIMAEASAEDPRIEVYTCRTKYPEGAERCLINAITGRYVNSSMLPADAGCIVHNISTIFAIYEAVFLGKPLYERILTFSGDAPADPGNFWVKVGMDLSLLPEKAGGFRENPVKIISGGPMMGFAQVDLCTPETKTSSAITCLTKDDVADSPTTACIRCGKCVEVCPARLMPVELSAYAEYGKLEEFEKHYGLECVNCGSCSFTCPAKRPLAQRINQARMTVLANKKKAASANKK